MESKFWVNKAKKEYFFTEDREITYEVLNTCIMPEEQPKKRGRRKRTSNLYFGPDQENCSS